MVSRVDTPSDKPPKKPVVETKKSVVIRFAGDSGDGMQLTGTEFTRAVAIAGNDIATFPDYPAEIRAPVGTLAGVSGYQLHFSSEAIHTPGDAPDVLVVMNPAALKRSLAELPRGGMIIANSGAFTDANLQKVGYQKNPLEDGSLEGYRVFAVDMQAHCKNALEGMAGIDFKEVSRSKNMWALGLMYWLFNRPVDKQLEWLKDKFKKNPAILEANLRVFKAGHAFGDTVELFHETYQVDSAPMEAGTYRNVMGNQMTALGLATAAVKAGLPMFFGAYPITPASDVLHNIAKFKNYGVTTFQAEDEIAAMCSAIGAAYGGVLGVTCTSGPGFALKLEAMGLAVMMELPVVIIDVQRAGPSTGLPTKTEQSDLLQALYGRNGDSPLAVIAAQSPVDCFATAIEAVRIATKYMTPVVVLTDGYIANGAEPWKLPDVEKDIPPIEVKFRTDPNGYQVYGRDPQTLARAWVRPGTPKMEHRVGGLEKDFLTGMVSYDNVNHQKMVDVRADKVLRMRQDISASVVDGAQEGDLLVVGWGGTYGALKQSVQRLAASGKKIGHLHLRWLNPLPGDLEAVFARFKKVIVCELNGTSKSGGQLWRHLRAELLVPALHYTKVQGTPFTTAELGAAFEAVLRGEPAPSSLKV
ncbi:MAG: 2-oxoacid:acceptor oxidoreductase subunit alpha [Deltaproteobacteria bacterium]|nr:2-oxoacid:acceptor oxidoreductase subunit alpha [Deltaproteobacteria bacterium]